MGVVLNINPRTTVIDVLPQLQAHTGPLDPEFLSQMMVAHPSGVKVLLAPSSPEKAELVTAEHVQRVLAALQDVTRLASTLADLNLAAAEETRPRRADPLRAIFGS